MRGDIWHQTTYRIILLHMYKERFVVVCLCHSHTPNLFWGARSRTHKNARKSPCAEDPPFCCHHTTYPNWRASASIEIERENKINNILRVPALCKRHVSGGVDIQYKSAFAAAGLRIARHLNFILEFAIIRRTRILCAHVVVN